MKLLLVIPFVLQGLFIFVDEFYFHHRRDLPRWERLGHPVDTLSLILCVAVCAFFPFQTSTLYLFIGLSIFSCLCVTKDEWIHGQKCDPAEMWVHSCLFILHPLVLISFGLLWWKFPGTGILKAQTALLTIYFLYQSIYWNIIASAKNVNNQFYDDLGDKWYKAQDHPIALLRAGSKFFVEWIDVELRKRFQPEIANILDIGCGGGLIANELAKRGWKITGVDLSEESLEIARRFDETKSVNYKKMDATDLDFDDHEFDAVISLDMLEHVENPDRVIAECSRVLKSNGTFFFHTFNRTISSWFFAVKAIEWFVPNAPEHIHLHRMFITIPEIKNYIHDAGLAVKDLKGVKPILNSKTLMPFLFRGKVSDEFGYQFTKDLKVGYVGFADKQT